MSILSTIKRELGLTKKRKAHKKHGKKHHARHHAKRNSKGRFTKR